jgi:acyl carrier protein
MRAVGEIENQLRTLVAERLGARETDIGEETSLKADLGADSIELVSLIVEIEDEFEIDIPDEDAMQIATVKQLMDYVAFAAAAKDLDVIPKIETRARGRHRHH